MDLELLPAPLVSDEKLTGIWERIGTKQQILFAGREVEDAANFIKLARADSSVFFVVVLGTEPAAITWLNGWEGYCARIHQCFFKEYYGQALSIAREVAGRLFKIKRIDGTPMVKTLIGLTPTPNRLAIRFAKKSGFKTVMEIPDSCTWRGESVPGLFSYLSVEDFNVYLQ